MGIQQLINVIATSGKLLLGSKMDNNGEAQFIGILIKVPEWNEGYL